jgi:catechol 2,3-dioxygenase-like lactoylglutathione lyase family enzyme
LAREYNLATKNLPSEQRADPATKHLDRKDPYLRVLCVNVFVRDQDKSLRFYVDRFGFGVVIDDSYESGGRCVAVAPPDGNTVLALMTPKRTIRPRPRFGAEFLPASTIWMETRFGWWGATTSFAKSKGRPKPPF